MEKQNDCRFLHEYSDIYDIIFYDFVVQVFIKFSLDCIFVALKVLKVISYKLFIKINLNLLMEEQEDQSEYLQRINQMKVFYFRQQKQQILKKQVFAALYSYLVCQPKNHYNLSLYCKTFQGLMKYIIETRQFQNRLQNFYARFLLKTHFQAIKEYRLMSSVQINKKVQMMNKIRQKNAFFAFTNFIKIKNVHKNLKDIAKAVPNKQENTQRKNLTHLTQQKQIRVASKTQALFYQQKPTQMQINHNKTFYQKSKQLTESRRSVQSNFSIKNQLHANRKFAAVRQLPQMPSFPSKIPTIQAKNTIQQRKFQDQSTKKYQTATLKTEKIDEAAKKIQKPVIQQQQKIIQVDQKNQNKQKQKQSKISLISKIKMVEYKTLKQIIFSLKSVSSKTSLHAYEKYLQQSANFIEAIKETS